MTPTKKQESESTFTVTPDGRTIVNVEKLMATKEVKEAIKAIRNARAHAAKVPSKKQ